MLTRRGFIGSLIGMAAGAPFLAQLLERAEKPVCLDGGYRFGMIAGYRASELHKINGTAMVDGPIQLDRGIWKFVAHDLLVTAAMVTPGFYLLDRWGNKLRRGMFCSAVYCVSGDTLKTTYTFQVHNARIGESFESTYTRMREQCRVRGLDVVTANGDFQ